MPDDNWEYVEGKTENLSQIYADIYKKSTLKYEIEMFDDDGTCKIMFIRNEHY